MGIIDSIAQYVQAVWTISGLFIYICKVFGNIEHPWMQGQRWLFAELRPFYLPCTFFHITYLAMTEPMWGWNIVNTFFQLLNWFLYKDVDDDDRWKKRKAKLVEKITRIGSRLVVAPT